MNIAATRPPRAHVTKIIPSAKEDKFIGDSTAFLSMTASFFSYILYGEMQIVHTHDVPLAATDARSIFFNAKEMLALDWTIENGCFVEAHEVSHYLLADLINAMGWRELGIVPLSGGRSLPYDHDLMNAAMDYRINAMLIEANIGTMPKQGLYDPKISATGEESCVEIYEVLYNQGQGGGSGGFDIHLEPTDADIAAEKGNGAAKRGLAIAAALEATQGQGAMPAAFRRMIGEILNPKVKWQDHLAATMRRASGEPRHDWSKINKRLISRPVGGKIVFARKSSYGCGTIVIGWDTSGSTAAWQDRFFAEMTGIVSDLNPAELIVIRCDAKVHGFDTLDEPTDLNQFRDQVNDEGVGGGGGTKFEPVFEAIAEHHIEPDMLVYLTDMLGTFPESQPDYPVIWANIRPDLKSKMPFGHMVEIEGD